MSAWIQIRDGDARALGLYLRHYSAKRSRPSRRRPNEGSSRLFVGPGEKLILLTADASALFSWRLSRHRKDEQTGVECSIFRNEGPLLSSTLIAEACDLAWARWAAVRLFTFIDAREIASPNPGYCFKRAGFRRCGRSAGGLEILERVS